MTEQRQLERTLRQLERQDLLVLDELGYRLRESKRRLKKRRSMDTETEEPSQAGDDSDAKLKV